MLVESGHIETNCIVYHTLIWECIIKAKMILVVSKIKIIIKMKIIMMYEIRRTAFYNI